jgi:primosomal protein N' (replication factor Y)
MKLLKVVPITKGVSKELSYFTIKDVNKGALVTIPLRKKSVTALVVKSEEVKDQKTKIRQSPYSLKGIRSVKTANFFTKEFVTACQKIAEYFLADTGSVIKELCPQAILEKTPTTKTSIPPPENTEHDISLFQALKRERIKYYKNLIRAEFAKDRSIFLCVPSAQKVKEYEQELKKGVEQYIFSFNSKLSKKEMERRWIASLEEKHPVLIIATGLFLSLPRTDIKTVIIDDEGSPLYKPQNRPFVDIRKAAEILSKETNSSLILADEIVRLESYLRKEKNEISSVAHVSPKILSRAEESLINIGPLKTTISNELKEMIESSYKNNEHTLIFINRRGYELSTVCNDCGKILGCIKCSTPLVLHKDYKRKFVCHKCLSEYDVIERCPYCKSWKLVTLGSGIQKVNEEIQKLFPEFKIFRLDKDSIKSRKEGEELLDRYQNTAGAILISTELLFSFFSGSFDRIGVVSVDGLFNLPDFGINERIFRMLMRLKMRARKNFLVQTRMPDNQIFLNLFKGNIGGFYNAELSAREQFGYPPFKTLIKIICEDKNKQRAKSEITKLKQRLKTYNPIVFAAFTPKIKNYYRFYLLIKVEPKTWPEEQKELHSILSSLPRNWKIELNPESLL